MVHKLSKDFIRAYVEFNTSISIAYSKIKVSPCRQSFLVYLEQIFRKNFVSNLKKFVDKEGYEKLEIPILDQSFNFKSNNFAVNLLKYYNKSMLEYISKVSAPILLLANDKLKTLNDDDLDEFVFIYSNLFWLLCMQVEGIDISCDNLKHSSGCIVGCYDVFKPTNIIRLYIVPEYVTSPCVTDKIISTFDLLKKDKILVIVDYTNICSEYQKYKWENTGSYEKYECVFNNINCYFYNCKCVDFGKYTKKVQKRIINNNSELRNIIRDWTSKMKNK